MFFRAGLPEILDSNRCRHGDFEFGPVAVFQHNRPDRLQQLMLLRVEFLNTAAGNAGQDIGQGHQAANAFANLNQVCLEKRSLFESVSRRLNGMFIFNILVT